MVVGGVVDALVVEPAQGDEVAQVGPPVSEPRNPMMSFTPGVRGLAAVGGAGLVGQCGGCALAVGG